ncbi:MAG TPA: right-handed parallel beta-helix repeat-containing protein [Bryobacteraceae bacterium]|nr:right-handed parallel beta-helix repeat-containing protein [Bryobacteraceae bacterium]
MSRFQTLRLALPLLLAGHATVLFGVDGVVLIDQNRALAGNVTPGDTPGFPIWITQPGSYRLSGNLTVPGELSGIEVRADGVTIDLNGFSIIGPGAGAGRGIDVLAFFAVPAFHETTVLNGTVRRMGNAGIVLGDRSRVENVRAISNGLSGIFVGSGSVVRNNISYGHSIGIQAVFSSVVGNTARNNSTVDIQAVDSTRDQNFPAP